MPDHRDTVTRQLAHVILTIQLGEQTGTLTVERGTGPAFEEGWMIFINGQLVWAKASQREGMEAFRWFKTWTTCRFAFNASIQSDLIAAISLRSALPSLSDQSPTGEHGGTPYRTRRSDQSVSLISRLGLSRVHRRVFLLIDGRRTTAELASLIGCSPDKLQVLLVDLERAGIIHY